MITEKFVKKSVKEYLEENNWSTRYQEADKYEKGVDIIVVNDKAERYFFIEAKGESDKPHVNTNSVIFALGQIVTRMKVIAKHAYLYGVAYPEPLAKDALRKVPYQFAKEIGFYIFSVDEEGQVKKYDWKHLRKHQID